MRDSRCKGTQKSCIGTVHKIILIQSVPGGRISILGGHSICHSKQMCMYTCAVFRTISDIELFHCTVPKLFIRNRYYVLFLISVFIVQVTKLVHFM
jgi:hypothetical protein